MKGNQHLNGLTFILAVFHFIAMYLYKYLSSDVIFWNVNGKENKIFQFFGGISPIDSSNLVCVILYILPVYVFCIYIGNFFVKELKKNVVFLLLRNGNRIKWLQKMLYQVFLYTSYYEILFLFMVIIMQLGYGGITIYYVKELIFLFTFEFLRTLCFSFLSSICFFFFSETWILFIDFLILCIPILCVGILYETHGGWQIPARYFLFNIFNNTYRYATHGGWQITIIFAILGCVLIYEVGRWKIIHYE